ncbi:MAG: class I SAM-dependent methyltransferase [Solirubrobacteraceae bacterium]
MTDLATNKLSPSVARGLPLSRKLSEGAQLFREYRRRARSGYGFDALFDDIDEYHALLRQHADLPLRGARILEIGFGARPHRQMVLHSMGLDAIGIDAEAPMLSGHPTELLRVVKQNGLERAAKSLLRHTLFDGGERRALSSLIARRGFAPRLDTSRLIVNDASELELPRGSLDLILSEDVFEHVERTSLERLVARMADWLSPGGLALIRPNVFTGIVGGHLLEWSNASMREPPPRRRSEPWEHLRECRFAPNTYLNQLSRAEYRELLARRFEILEERVAHADLGREYLDERARGDLSDYPEEELFSNQTLFVLKPRPG